MTNFEMAIPPALSMVTRWLPTLADAAMKGFVVIILAALLASLYRRRSAAVRHAIWAGALAAQLAIPLLARSLPRLHLPMLPALPWTLELDVDQSLPLPPAPAPVGAPVLAGPTTQPGMVELAPSAVWLRGPAPRAASAGGAAPKAESAPELVIAASVSPTPPPAAAPPVGRRHIQLSLVDLLAGLWLVGCIGVLLRLLVGTLSISRLAASSRRVVDGRWLSLTQRLALDVGIARPLTLLDGDCVSIPVTWGILYPVVLLPSDAESWSEERRRYVLVHEMAHVKRFDALTQIVGQAAVALFWFNPLVWIAMRSMRVERERACDDYVLRHGTMASRYASDLLAMVRGLRRQRSNEPAFAALAMASGSDLEGRMRAILDARQERATPGRGETIMSVIAALVLIAPLAAWRPYQQQPVRPAAPAPAVASAAPVAAAAPAPASVATSRASVAIGIGAGSGFGASAGSGASASAGYATTAAKAPRAPGASAAPAAAAGVSVSSGYSCSTTTMAERRGGKGSSQAPARSKPVNRGQAARSTLSTESSGHSMSYSTSRTESDGSPRVFQYVSSNGDRCLQALFVGEMTFSTDDRDITRLARGAMVHVRERLPDLDRDVTVTPGDDGAIRYEYFLNDQSKEFLGEGQAWFRGLLQEVIRESGINAEERVQRIRRERGVEGALKEISRVQSTGVKGTMYRALVDQGGMNDRETEIVVRQAGRDLASSDGTLSSVLARLPRRSHLTAGTTEAVGEVLSRMSSDGEKRTIIQQFTTSGDREILVIAMREARNISSDGEKGELLKAVASRYLTSGDDSLRRAFFNTLASVSSDGEHAEVLKAVLSTPARSSEPVTHAVLHSAKDLSSDGEKAEVLVQIANAQLLTTPRVRDAFWEAARSLGSDSEYRRVVEATLKK